MRTLLLAVALFVTSITTAVAQNYPFEWQNVDTLTVIRTPGEQRMLTDERTNVVPKAIFVELAGPSTTLGYNFEARLGHRLNGLGIRAGFGIFSVDGDSMISIPVGFNYLMGKRGKYFEMGLTGTLWIASSDPYGDDLLAENGKTQTKVIGNFTFGYRRQPVKGGFLFRAGLSPLFFMGANNKLTFNPLFPYLAVGYSF